MLDVERERLWHPYTSVTDLLPVYPGGIGEGCRLRLMATSNQWLKEQGLVSTKELWSRFYYPASTA